MLPDVKWLDILKLPLVATLGGALVPGALLLLAHLGVLDLDALGAIWRPTLIAFCATFSVLSLVGIVNVLLWPVRERRRQSLLAVRRAVRRREEDEQRAKAEARALESLDHLSKEEIRYVAKCLRNGSPTFYTWVHSSPAAMLQGKGLVWTTGATHHQDHYPYSFRDFAWRALLERREEFLEKDRKHEEAERAAEEAERRQSLY